MQALNTLWRSWVVLTVMALSPVLFGQAGDFDLEIRLDRGEGEPTGRAIRSWPGPESFRGRVERRAGPLVFATIRRSCRLRASP